MNSIYFISPEIVDSDNSCTINNRINKHPYIFVFNIFAKDNNKFINDGQLLAK
jgi:GTP-dependent phosphoenolpyruvate carboxykinase